MIFKVYKAEIVARQFFKYYFMGSLVAGLIALSGIVSGAGIASTLAGVFYIAVATLLSLNRRFRKSPFSILLCFFTFIYLTVPAALVLVEGSEYSFGTGLASIPSEQGEYEKALPFGFLWLALLWFTTWLAIVSPKVCKWQIRPRVFSSIKLKHLLLLGFIVLAIALRENLQFVDVQVETAEKGSSLLSYLLFDHGFLVLSGLLLAYKLNEPRYVAEPRRITRLTFAIFLGFTAVQFMAGSKAAILVMFLLVVLLPFSLLSQYPGARVPFPAPRFIVLLVVMTPALFYLALILRISRGLGVAPDLTTLLTGMMEVDSTVLAATGRDIFYRLSQGGLDRFLLIFQSFVINGFDPFTAGEFVRYAAKNTVNLALPGTPFPDAYVQTSQLLGQVMDKQLVGLDLDATTILKSLNTQAYTLFGVFVVVFGLAAPIFLYLVVYAYVVVFNRIRNVIPKMAMLYLFSAALSSYGIEVVLGNTILLLISMGLMYSFLSVLSRLRMMEPLRLDPLQSAAAAGPAS